MSDKTRLEKDSMGELAVPADKMWGASTQRSLQNFKIGSEKIPYEMVVFYALLKKAVTIVNKDMDLLDEQRCEAIVEACDEILAGEYKENFPLPVWQTGSGTQFNSNVSEVITYRANEILAKKGLDIKVHANDHVNLSQSSNDLFPTAMHMIGVELLATKVLPALQKLQAVFQAKAEEYKDLIKTGRTHMMDAVPITFGQEISAWARMMERNYEFLVQGQDYLKELALGGMVLGTGLATYEGLPEKTLEKLNEFTPYQFRLAKNKFHALTSKDEIVVVHGMLKTLAADLTKIANDVRILASGPRCGIGEITIPVNEPGSVIQPGKVNPTQCEAMNMVAAQIFGNDVTIGFAGSQGLLQLNVYMPVIAYNFIQSLHLLGDVIVSFADNCANGIKPRLDRMEYFLGQTMMTSTALVPLLGYDRSTQIIKIAMEKDITLKEAALSNGWLSEEDYDKCMDLTKMVAPAKRT